MHEIAVETKTFFFNSYLFVEFKSWAKTVKGVVYPFDVFLFLLLQIKTLQFYLNVRHFIILAHFIIFSVILLSWTTFDIKDNILDRLFVQDSETSSGVIFVIIIRHKF